jgi:pimeloyl-ACP methyl ester carboxylesterase
MTATPRQVGSSDGVSVAVYESGDADGPTVLAVHGYPDNHAVWDGVVELLAGRFHVVTYDVRGAGRSDKPAAVSAYRMDRLVDDLTAVIDAVSPNEPVHLLGHDWGSIQSWPAMTHEPLAGRIASFTSISGPSLDHSGAWLRRAREHPRASLRQLRHSYYIALFQLPGLPEWLARTGVLDRGIRRARSAAAAGAEPPRSVADTVNGISLYRANMIGAVGRPRPVPTHIPVQVIVAEQDPYATPDLVTGAPEPWVANLTVHRISGGHWVVSERPDVIARLVCEFVDSLPPTGPQPERGRRAGGPFAGRL